MWDVQRIQEILANSVNNRFSYCPPNNPSKIIASVSQAQSIAFMSCFLESDV